MEKKSPQIQPLLEAKANNPNKRNLEDIGFGLEDHQTDFGPRKKYRNWNG